MHACCFIHTDIFIYIFFFGLAFCLFIIILLVHSVITFCLAVVKVVSFYFRYVERVTLFYGVLETILTWQWLNTYECVCVGEWGERAENIFYSALFMCLRVYVVFLLVWWKFSFSVFRGDRTLSLWGSRNGLFSWKLWQILLHSNIIILLRHFFSLSTVYSMLFFCFRVESFFFFFGATTQIHTQNKKNTYTVGTLPYISMAIVIAIRH